MQRRRLANPDVRGNRPLQSKHAYIFLMRVKSDEAKDFYLFWVADLPILAQAVASWADAEAVSYAKTDACRASLLNQLNCNWSKTPSI